MSSYYIDRLMAGQWLAVSKVIEAKYPGGCKGCGGTIQVGDRQAAVHRVDSRRSEKGWMHEACMKADGMHPFAGKSR